MEALIETLNDIAEYVRTEGVTTFHKPWTSHLDGALMAGTPVQGFAMAWFDADPDDFGEKYRFHRVESGLMSVCVRTYGDE